MSEPLSEPLSPSPSLTFRADLLITPPHHYSDTVSFMPCALPMIDDHEFLIYLLPASVMLNATCIPRHEEIIEDLVCMSGRELRGSKISEQSIFISHRWVGNSPDSDDNAQLHYIQQALKLFKYSEDMFIWIDYSCMKQNSTDLPTIQRLNYILSFCAMFMVVLPAYDVEGAEYVQRVWCVYEWLSVLHFKRSFIFPSRSFSTNFLRLTLKSVLRVVDPGVLSYLEQARLGFNSIMPLLAEHVSRVYLPDGIFSKDLFVESLQAFKAEDKAYAHSNLSSLFTMEDLLFLHAVGGEKSLPLQCISVKECDPSSIVLSCQQQREPGWEAAQRDMAAQVARFLAPPPPPHLLGSSRGIERRDRDDSRKSDSSADSSSLSSLGFGEGNWRELMSSSSDDEEVS